MTGRRQRLVVVDDHHLVRAGVRSELLAHCDVVGEAADPAQAITVIAETCPDVVLLDVHIPDGGGRSRAARAAGGFDAARRARPLGLRCR
jgi:DNA-binding NarL/FixJ family response regulator